MKKLLIFLSITSICGCLLNAQTTVDDALSVNFINPMTSTSNWALNKMTINASESFGLANYDGNSTSTVLSGSAWNNLDINNGLGAPGSDSSVYHYLPVLNDSSGNPLSVTGSFSGRLQNGTNWASPVDQTDFKDTVYFSTYTLWNMVNMVPMVHLRDLNSYAGTYDLIVYTHSTSTSPQSVAGIISVELDEVSDNIDHNGDGTIGDVDTNGDGEIQLLEGEVYGVQTLESLVLDYSSGPVQPVVLTGLSANNINISAYNVGGNSDSMFMVGGFQIIPTSEPTASVDPVLTITSSEGGSTDLEGSNSYTSGSSVTVTATPDTGYAFAGWTGSVSSSDNPLTITIDSTTNLVANFEALLTVDENAVIAVGWNTIDNADGYTSSDVNPADDSTPDSQIANFTGVLGTAVTTDSTNGGGKVVFPSADNISDTSYGSISFLESVSSASGVRLDTFSGANSRLDIKMTNNSGSDVTVAGIHFDAKLHFGTEGAEMSIAHLSSASDLLDTNPNGSAFNSRNFSNKIIPAGSSAWSNYDISPGSMTDLVLADGESVAFRITLNQVNSVHCAVYLDNLGISILPIDGQSLLTVQSSTGGTVDNLGSTFKTTGESVTITATPDTGYEFTGWTGSDSSDNPLTVTLDAALSLVANFQELQTVSDNAVIAVGWNTIDNAVEDPTSTNPADDSTPDSQIANFVGVLGSSITGDSTSGGGKGVYTTVNNSGDTSYGSKSFLESVASASGVRLDTYGGSSSQLDIKMTNNSGSDVTVAGIHFDAKLNFGTEGVQINVSHLSATSDLLDTNPNGSAFNSRNFSSTDVASATTAWVNYDISPESMTDIVLADGESAAFRISLAKINDTDAVALFDNLGISILPIEGQSLLRVGSSSGGTVDNLGSSFKTTGESVTLIATADAGYEFISWTGSTSLDNPLTVTVNEASTIIANFQPLFDDNAVVIVGWNSFPIDSSSNVSSEAPDTVANGFSGNLGTSVYGDVATEGGGSHTAANANSYDYTYGRAYNISDSDLGSDLSGISLSTFGGNTKRYVDLSVSNNTSGDLLLSGIHFDIGHLFFQADLNSDEEGAVLSDKGATIKVIHLQMAQGTSPSDLQDTFNQRTIASFNLPDGSLSMFSKSMDFGDLADTTLAAGETAAFRIEVENAAGGSNNPYNVGATIDNIAITGTPAGDIYTLNVTDGSVAGGNVDLNGASKYVSGQVVNLTATPAEGYTFIGWTGDVESTDATITVTMSSDLNVSPQFALATLPALAIASDAGSITISWEGSASLGLSSSETLSGTFEAVSGSVETNGNSHSYTESIQGTQKFFRLGTE
jgi:uncharacterized repeat protein (TIGR02543 family)